MLGVLGVLGCWMLAWKDRVATLLLSKQRRMRVRVLKPNTPNTQGFNAKGYGGCMCVGLAEQTQHVLNTPNTLIDVVMQPIPF